MLALTMALLSTQAVIPSSNYALDGRSADQMAFGARLTKHHVNAIGEGMLLAQADAPPPPPPVPAPSAPVAGDAPTKSLQDLRAEYQRLDESRPGIVAPIVMLALGVPAAIVGIYLVYYGVVFGLLANSSAALLVGVIFLGIGVVVLAAGIVLAVIGGVKLGRGLGERRRIGNEMEEIKKQIEALESAPPPPPPPSSVERNTGPAPILQLATF